MRHTARILRMRRTLRANARFINTDLHDQNFLPAEMKCLLVVASLLTLGCCQSNLNAYPFSAVLRADGSGNPLYTLHWNFSATEETITFGVNVSTNGWVGFGISPNGGMTNSDVVIGWVNDNGEVFFDVSKKKR